MKNTKHNLHNFPASRIAIKRYHLQNRQTSIVIPLKRCQSSEFAVIVLYGNMRFSSIEKSLQGRPNLNGPLVPLFFYFVAQPIYC